MTRKDYEAIAGSFLDVREERIHTDSWYSESIATWIMLRDQIADVFQADNPRFDRERFYRATEGSDK